MHPEWFSFNRQCMQSSTQIGMGVNSCISSLNHDIVKRCIEIGFDGRVLFTIKFYWDEIMVWLQLWGVKVSSLTLGK